MRGFVTPEGLHPKLLKSYEVVNGERLANIVNFPTGLTGRNTQPYSKTDTPMLRGDDEDLNDNNGVIRDVLDHIICGVELRVYVSSSEVGYSCDRDGPQ